MPFTLVVIIALAGITKASPSPTTIAVDPAQPKVVDLGKSFIVTVNVTDVDDLYLCMFRLKWNNSLIQLNNMIEGPFIEQGGTTAFITDPALTKIDEINAAGRINEVTCTLLALVPGVSGSGTIATLNFTALALGTTAIEFWENPAAGFENKTVLVDSRGVPEGYITHTRIDGSVNIVPEFPTPMFAALFLIAILVVAVLAKTTWLRPKDKEAALMSGKNAAF